MKGYKGFEKGLICKGKQYAENTVFEEEAVICENGMHFCKNPFDVLDYYGFVDEKGSMNEFAEVESLNDTYTYTNDDKKYCTTMLRVGAKLSFSGFVKACVDFAIERTMVKSEDITKDVINSKNKGDQIGSSGYSAQIGSSGDSAKIDSTGEDSVICCAGHGSAVKARKGSWITLSEWKFSEEKGRHIPVCVKT